MKNKSLMQFFNPLNFPIHKILHQRQKDVETVNERFAAFAAFVDETLPLNPETTACLRKLLEARDCAVRAYFYKGDE